MSSEKCHFRGLTKPGSLKDFWKCGVCTYLNTVETFKCLMCDIRKGATSRKPRLNPVQVGGQTPAQVSPSPIKVSKKHPTENMTSKRRNTEEKTPKKSWHPPRLRNVDRSSAQTREVTVNNVTVIITEYKPMKKNKPKDVGNSSPPGSGSNSTENSSDNKSSHLGTDSRSS